MLKSFLEFETTASNIVCEIELEAMIIHRIIDYSRGMNNLDNTHVALGTIILVRYECVYESIPPSFFCQGLCHCCAISPLSKRVLYVRQQAVLLVTC